MNSEFEEKLAVLRGKFVRNGIEKLEMLDETLARLTARPADAEVLDRAMRLFHSFAGAAGTYGFSEVSDAGTVAEEICDRVALDQRAIRLDELTILTRQIGTMRLKLLGGDGEDVIETIPQRILLLSTSADEAAFVRDTLETAGYQVRVCGAIEYLEIDCDAFQPHLIVLGAGAEKSIDARQTDRMATPERQIVSITMLAAEGFESGSLHRGRLIGAVAALLQRG